MMNATKLVQALQFRKLCNRTHHASDDFQFGFPLTLTRFGSIQCLYGIPYWFLPSFSLSLSLYISLCYSLFIVPYLPQFPIFYLFPLYPLCSLSLMSLYTVMCIPNSKNWPMHIVWSTSFNRCIIASYAPNNEALVFIKWFALPWK